MDYAATILSRLPGVTRRDHGVRKLVDTLESYLESASKPAPAAAVSEDVVPAPQVSKKTKKVALKVVN